MMKRLIFIFFTVLILTGCEDKTDFTPPVTNSGEEVQVKIKWSVAGILPGDETTRAAIAEQQVYPATRVIPSDMEDGKNYDDNYPVIQNIWIIQFDGKTPDAKMVGAPRFLSIEEDELVMYDPVDNKYPLTTSVPLVKVPNACYTLFVANIREGLQYNWNLTTESTFKDVITRTKQIQEENGTYEDFTALGSIGNRTLLMSAVTENEVDPDVILSPVFKRNVAKVKLNLTLDNQDMEIVSVQMRNVSNSILYADAALEKIGILNSTVFPVNFLSFNYKSITDKGILPEKGDTKTYSWYVPRNQQGVNARSTSSKLKTFYAPTNATYIEIIARKKDTHTSIFRIYPGANMENDYNLAADHLYTINLKVSGMGANNDTRAETIHHTVDYSGISSLGAKSNSFIINPAPIESGLHRTYRIGVHQVNRYWGESYDGYGKTDKNTIKNGEPWQVFLIWSDLPSLVDVNNNSTTAITLINNNGTTNPGGGEGPDQAFEINVPPGLPAGNFLIGIKKTKEGAEGELLWSWHFWVTDYNPDNFNRSLIKQDTYTYVVPGGQVERYGSSAIGDLWSETGTLNDRVMMDRNLGAVENFFTAQLTNLQTRGMLFYQYGRKDPLPGRVITAYNNFFTPNSSYGVVPSDDTNAVAISETVHNPWIYYINTGNWSKEAYGTDYLWNDPQTKSFTHDKSIYDPCPPGWRLPINGTWNDFARRDNSTSPYITTLNSLRDLGWDSGRGIGTSEVNPNGLRYWPGNTVDAPVAGRIWYPAIGTRKTGDPSINGPGGSVNNVSASPVNNALTVYAFNGVSNQVRPNYASSRGIGYSVRCIADRQ